MYPHQAERLDQALSRLGVDALVATSPANVAYVTGFRSGADGVPAPGTLAAVYTARGTGLVVAAPEALTLATEEIGAEHLACHGRFTADLADGAGESAQRAQRLLAEALATPADAVAAILERLGVRGGRIGVDDALLPHEALGALQARLAAFTLLPASPALAAARAVKSPYEIDCLAHALRTAETALAEMLDELRAGVTEREAATVYERAVRARGLVPWHVAVAFGERTAAPTPAPSDRPLRTADAVRLHVGAVHKGYFAEVARMGSLGEPDGAAMRRHDAVDAAVDAALQAIRPGATGELLFRAADDALRDRGLSGLPGPRAGHGIGLEPAEPPWLGPGAADAVEPGTVLCLGAASYALGALGVAVNETVLVTRSGATVINRSNRGLVVLD